MLFLLFLFLLAPAHAADWYKVRLTVFTPADQLVKGTKTSTGDWPEDLLARGECVLAASPTY